LSNNQKNVGSVPGKDLYRAMNSLRKPLGSNAVDLLMTDLQRQGITFAGGEPCPVRRIDEALKKTFGEGGGELLMDMLDKALQDL
jgi:hypothetical protein